MSLRSSTSLLCLSFALYRLGLAQGPDFDTNNWGRPSSTTGYGPWNTNYTDFSNSLDHPNATDTFDLPGPNLTLAYPDAPTGQAWSWTISVTDDIPITNTSRAHKDWEGKFFTGSRLRLNIPPYVAAAANATAQNKTVVGYDRWNVCVMYWRWESFGAHKNDSFPDKFREDDGSCSSILSSQCIQDWEALAVEEYSSTTGGCTAPVLSQVESCKGIEHADVLGLIGASMSYNSSEFGKMFNESHHLDLLAYGGELHDRGNVTAYKKTASLPWMTLVLWGSWPAQQFQNMGPAEATPVNTTAKLMCPRARGATAGSVDPAWNVTSAASGDHVGSALPWLMFGVSLAAFL
jgi:hypothetical protein